MKEQTGFCVVGHRLAILKLSRPLRDFSFVYAHPALERKALGVPGYSQSRLSALKIGSQSKADLPRIHLLMVKSLVVRITIL
jgi:hypothetical protein